MAAQVTFGPIPNIAEGAFFRDRQELHDLNLHRGLQGGIAPQGSSVVLSGGYIDDEVDGDTILCTGAGGQENGRQVSDQQLTRGNKDLAHNHLNGIPIRVFLGKKHSPDIPDGFKYKYIGIFRCTDYWRDKGKEGYVIYRFKLEKIRDGGGSSNGQQAHLPAGSKNPRTSETWTRRIIRDSKIGNHIKDLYDYTCQICGIRLEVPAGPYAECCHIKPLGKPAFGPDQLDNVLCLCPNCHVLLDEGALWIEDNLSIGGKNGKVRTHKDHKISLEYIQYHREARVSKQAKH